MDLFELLEAGKLAPFKDALQASSPAERTALNDDGASLLHVAVTATSNKYLAFAETLVAAGVPIDIVDDNGDSPLHAVIKQSRDGLNKQRLASATWLIEHGADVNHPGEIEATTLHTAIIKGAQLAFIEQLIAAGVDGRRRDHTARTPFFLSMGTSNAPDLWNLLLSKKWGGPGDVDERGNTPLHEAVSRHNASAVKFLLAKGADRTVKNAAGNTPLDEAQRYAKKLVPLLSK